MPDFDLDVGLLTKRISVYGPPSDDTVNENNEPTAAGTLIATLWAELNPQGSTGKRQRDAVEAGRDVSEQVDVWRVRYRTDVNESGTIQWNGMTWRIAAQEILGAKVAIDLQAVRVR